MPQVSQLAPSGWPQPLQNRAPSGLLCLQEVHCIVATFLRPERGCQTTVRAGGSSERFRKRRAQVGPFALLGHLADALAERIVVAVEPQRFDRIACRRPGGVRNQ